MQTFHLTDNEAINATSARLPVHCSGRARSLRKRQQRRSIVRRDRRRGGKRRHVNAGSDPACNYTKHQVAWQHWTLDIANIDQLAEPAVLDECIDKYTERWGPPQLSTNGHRDFCFMGFYRYNLSTRNSIRECFSLQCDKDALGCIDGKYINGEPWLAGVAQQ